MRKWIHKMPDPVFKKSKVVVVVESIDVVFDVSKHDGVRIFTENKRRLVAQLKIAGHFHVVSIIRVKRNIGWNLGIGNDFPNDAKNRPEFLHQHVVECFAFFVSPLPNHFVEAPFV